MRPHVSVIEFFELFPHVDVNDIYMPNKVSINAKILVRLPYFYT
jgi:hypothetical protein